MHRHAGRRRADTAAGGLVADAVTKVSLAGVEVARDLDPGKGDLRYRIRYEAAGGSVGPASASVAVHRP